MENPNRVYCIYIHLHDYSFDPGYSGMFSKDSYCFQYLKDFFEDDFPKEYKFLQKGEEITSEKIIQYIQANRRPEKKSQTFVFATKHAPKDSYASISGDLTIEFNTMGINRSFAYDKKKRDAAIKKRGEEGLKM